MTTCDCKHLSLQHDSLCIGFRPYCDVSKSFPHPCQCSKHCERYWPGGTRYGFRRQEMPGDAREAQ